MSSLFNSGVNHAAQVLLIKNPTLSLVFYRFSGEYLHPNNSTTHLSNVLEYATHPFCLYKTWLKNNGSAGSLYNCRNINFRFFCKKLLTTQQTIKSKKVCRWRRKICRPGRPEFEFFGRGFKFCFCDRFFFLPRS